LRLLHIFPSFEIGGAQARFAQIANYFAARFEHVVVALDGCIEARRLVNSAVSMEIVALPYDKRSQLRNLWRFRAELERRRHDLLLTYNWGAVDWALANRMRSTSRHVHMEDGFGPDEADRQFRRRIWFRRIALTGRQTTVVVPSQTLRAIARDVWRLPERGVVYLPNGIDCTRFRGREGAPREPGSIVIGTVASLRAEKNLGRLVHAFALLRRTTDARLVIVGDGPERAALERLTGELGLAGAVEFIGATPTPEAFYRRMDVFAISSDTEQMPYSVLEAMASGLPIVATDVGDIAQMVSEPNRQFVIADRTPDAFARTLAALVADPDLRADHGAANRKAALARFDLDVMLARYLSLFEGGSPA
jgi:glycosyltransferase involved in cell wall biosynthesis